MGIVNVILNIKKIHPKDIAIIKIGNFYYVYGKDAFIISYIFKYKLRYGISIRLLVNISVRNGLIEEGIIKEQ